MTSAANAPFFTVVTVCLNAEEHIRAALASVLAQGRSDFEYLVVDGASTDDTLQIVNSFAGRFEGRLRVVSEPDEGLYDAMNKALLLACGEYIAFLGADDSLTPSALDAVARAVSRVSRPDIVCGATRVVGPSGEWTEPPRSFAASPIPKRAPARHQSMFVRREMVIAAGGFETAFPIAADYELYLRLHESGAGELLIDDVLSRFALGGASSADSLRTAMEYRDIHVAHGANPLLENVLAYKSAFAADTVAAWMRLRHRLREGR